MAFYHLEEEMGLVLKDIVNKLFNNKRDYSPNDLGITWINYKKENNFHMGFGYGINNKKQIYPASLVKLIYGLAINAWIEKKRIIYNEELNNAVFKMLFDSSNDATSYIVDILTGTTSGPSLEGEMWKKWKSQRQIINDWILSLKWEELDACNCCQKTWEDGPFGREKDFYGENNSNRNSLSTDATARIMEEIMKNTNYIPENIDLKNCLHRTLNRDKIIRNSNNQIEGFLGEGLPEKISFWSKAGLMSEARHDSAWWLNNDLSITLLVVFGNGKAFAKDNLFLPKIAQAIYEFNQRN